MAPTTPCWAAQCAGEALKGCSPSTPPLLTTTPPQWPWSRPMYCMASRQPRKTLVWNKAKGLNPQMAAAKQRQWRWAGEVLRRSTAKRPSASARVRIRSVCKPAARACISRRSKASSYRLALRLTRLTCRSCSQPPPPSSRGLLNMMSTPPKRRTTSSNTSVRQRVRQQILPNINYHLPPQTARRLPVLKPQNSIGTP